MAIRRYCLISGGIQRLRQELYHKAIVILIELRWPFYIRDVSTKNSPKVLFCIYFLMSAMLGRKNRLETW